MNRIARLATTLTAATLLFACSINVGPFFAPQNAPEDQRAFNNGRIGLLTPDLNKQDELLAFRLLSGLKVEEAAGSGAGTVQPEPIPGIPGTSWMDARRRLVNPPAPVAFISVYRSSRSTPYVFYLNCMSEAFDTAAHTLEDRQKTYSSPQLVTDWVLAQDRVFSNCSGGPNAYIPDPPPSDAPPLAKADREYQLAAAHFYAEDLSDAEQRFRSISGDKQSSWQHIAAYMVGRTLLREVSLQKNAAAAPLAREALQKVANDPTAGTLADSARGLIQHLDAIEHADTVIADLSKQLLLSAPAPGALDNTLRQSTYILTGDSFSKARAQPGIAEPFDWVRTLEKEDGTYALVQWQKTQSLPWLTLSLMFANGKDSGTAALIDAADRLKPDSPAYGTASYNAIRLRIQRGETDEPRKQLDAIFASAKDQPDSLTNAWKAERMRLATNFDDFLRWAPRKPVGAAFVDKLSAVSEILGSDSAYFLNYQSPVSKLIAAAHSQRLPAWSANDVSLAAWTRALMLNDAAGVKEAAPLVAQSHSDWAPSLAPDQTAPSAAWRFRAALLIAEHHEITPLVVVDYRNHSNAGSWWCAVPSPNGTSKPPLGFAEAGWRLPQIYNPPDAVLSPAEGALAKAELDKLTAVGSAQSFLGPIIFDWQKTHPDDPLVPQALHRLVIVIRYGCPGPENATISKTAFDLLHTRYPKSEWTAKTPYWFK